MDALLSEMSSTKLSMAFQPLLILCTVLGLFHLFKAFIVLSQWAWASFFKPMKDLKQYGSWAVVTGPTECIGRSIAFRLAGLGLNLVLVDGNRAKLSSVDGEIRAKFGSIKVRSIVADFSRDVDEGMKRIEEGIKELDVGILINNAATRLPHPVFMHEGDVEQTASIIRVNVEALTRVTHVVLPLMVKKRKGFVVNISTAAGCIMPSFPLSAVYGATRAYVHHFSKSLSVEYRRFGIRVQCQAPFFVATKREDLKPSLFIPTADEYAKWCLRWMGNPNQCVCSPYWAHSIQWLAARLTPEALVNMRTFREMLRRHEKGKKKENDLKAQGQKAERKVTSVS